uniref:Uncharacterized protein n=1 Tax=Lotus japonicus TaxID=34305 RepID=I3SQX8_LOTJA|nr:unknown [Lotus japonicus]
MSRQVQISKIHSCDTVVLAGDMEPGTGADKRGIPALKHVIGVGEALLEGVESVAFGIRDGEGNEG